MDNTLRDVNGISTDVYEDNIYSLADEYIATKLNKSEDISKKQCFGGMIKYIAMHIDRPDTRDIVLLDKLWGIYASLCYKYNHVISIERYCILININRDTFYSWYKGETRNEYSKKLGSLRSDTVKNWDKESESSWQDEASTGNPGPMFVLKSRRGWSEQAPAIGMAEDRMLHRTPEQIAEDYVKIESKTGNIEPNF